MQHQKYFCSSTTWYQNTTEIVIQNNNLKDGSGCFDSSKFVWQPYYQAYNQYTEHFRDMKNDADFVSGVINDDDDENYGQGPIAIMDNQNIQELYFISQDKTKRFFIRRSLIATWDRNHDDIHSGDNESLYSLQILRLKWFDAGINHDFDINTAWVYGIYDGEIDTRACDYAEGFVCHGTPISNSIYPNFNLPQDANDWRVTISSKNLTISNRNIKSFPNKDPQQARAEDYTQINPYVTISITNKLYWEKRKQRIWNQSMDDFQITLQTTFNTKNFYGK